LEDRTDEPRSYESELANKCFCMPDKCVDRISELQGQHCISYFGANFAFGSMEHYRVMYSMKLFAEEVIPKFT
jgi:hypothetical protein